MEHKNELLTKEEVDSINKYMALPYSLSFSVEEAMRIKNNLNCNFCIDRKHTKETRCGKCKKIAEHIKETKILSPVLF